MTSDARWELSRDLLLKKLEFLESSASIGTKWWFSATALYSTILGAVWITQHGDDARLPTAVLVALGLVVAIAIVFTIQFGSRSQTNLLTIQRESRDLANALGVPLDGRDSEFEGVVSGWRSATQCFVLILAVWIALVLYLLFLKA
jgi:hypothetical protein